MARNAKGSRDPEFEFLRASSFKPARVDADGAVTLPAGFRIKTV